MSEIFFAVGDTAAHEGFVTSRSASSDWQYQDITGAHGHVCPEGTTQPPSRLEIPPRYLRRQFLLSDQLQVRAQQLVLLQP